MSKAIIYLRTSTTEQNPKLQEQDCRKFAEQKGLEVIDAKPEKKSAYKQNLERPVFNEIVDRAKKEKLHIILWKYDRAFRRRKEFYSFMREMFEVYGIKVYSATEQSILTLWEMIDSFNSVKDEAMRNFLQGIIKEIWKFNIQQAGELAEEESRNKGLRVKNAVRKRNGKTYSYKNKLWGRKQTIPKECVKDVIEKRNMGLSIREISMSVWYWDTNRNQKFLSKSAVHKILSENQDKLEVKNPR